MRKIFGLLITALSSISVQASTVVTFDDILPYYYTGEALPHNYMGLQWGWLSVQSGVIDPAGYMETASGTQYAATAAKEVEVSFAGPVVFEGAFFGSNQYDYNASYDLFLNGNLVHSSSEASIFNTKIMSTWVASGYSGLVDAVILRSSSWEAMAFDNFTYSAAQPVPEPESYAMLLAGLGLMGSFLRRRKK